MACCCGICDCQCTEIKITLSGCTEINGEYILTADAVYGSQCLFSITQSGVTLKYNCRTNHFFMSYGGDSCSYEATIETESPFLASGSCSIDCGGGAVSVFADIECNSTGCICCNFSDGDTIDAVFTSDCDAIDGMTVTLTYSSDSAEFFGNFMTGCSPTNYGYYLRCGGGTWTAEIKDDSSGNEAVSVSFSCSGSGIANHTGVSINNVVACTGFECFNDLLVTFGNSTSTTNTVCNSCCCTPTVVTATISNVTGTIDAPSWLGAGTYSCENIGPGWTVLGILVKWRCDDLYGDTVFNCGFEGNDGIIMITQLESFCFGTIGYKKYHITYGHNPECTEVGAYDITFNYICGA